MKVAMAALAAMTMTLSGWAAAHAQTSGYEAEPVLNAKGATL
jgi:hypothetical protein